ncbi:fumarylacetoacetate hydrolase family protein [Caldivirga maquilingensis]|uniref:Fumarylacetoacetate (FAA) hydrolase n=1 Tax=Caldivirga maquilingensis (strain ATCC 700844 / DSM 13496 / JCM 10307 / IC-167) TaxID=397948 RepID=A8MAS1_CALMQ|nr:fumarylacetoacetate hydrolase family protein [Caldivirga maquilingensis]ABW01107.1 fumarylacetoacetate (FAA) hydrolase [Caldivirga maquilingensis IC-167]
MRIFRLTNGESTFQYAVVDGKVFELGVDPVKALISYANGKVIGLGAEVNIDVNQLLSRDYRSSGLRFTKPYDPPEVWGSGISYEVSRRRYSEEGEVARIGELTIYERVYDAERPEIFFKATANRCVGHGEPIAVRGDSEWTLPEPELGVVITSSGKVIGYTIIDDVSARDIEAENPLYLPQSKVYNGCCAFGPFVVTPDEVKNPYSLQIRLRIIRSGKAIYEGEVSTERMRRRIDEQIKYLIRNNTVPDGTILMTGTGILPGRDAALRDGDVVEISISGVGTLTTPVIKLKVE